MEETVHRRTVLAIISNCVVSGACSFSHTSNVNQTLIDLVSPSSTTPLITAFKRDGYTVEELKNSSGGVALLINGKLQQIKVGTILIGIDPSLGIDPAKSGPPTLDIGQYEVPDNLGYVLVV